MAQYRTSTYRAPAYTKTFTKSYSTSTTPKTYRPVARPTTVINTTIVHQPVYTHSWGWHPWYSTPVVVAPVVATQPIMDVGMPMPQPVYYGDSFGSVGLLLMAVVIATVAFVVIRKRT